MLTTSSAEHFLSDGQVQEYILDLSWQEIFQVAWNEGWAPLLGAGLYGSWRITRRHDEKSDDHLLVAVLMFLALQMSPLEFWHHNHFGHLWFALFFKLVAMAYAGFALWVVLLVNRLLGKPSVRLSGFSILSVGCSFLTMALNWALLLFFSTPFFKSGY